MLSPDSSPLGGAGIPVTRQAVSSLPLWAKSPEADLPYPLLAHLLDTVCAADAIWRLWLRPGLREQLDHQTFLYLAGVHDIGKANPIFQLQLAARKTPPWREQMATKLAGAGLTVPDRGIPTLICEEATLRRHERLSAVHIDGFDLGEKRLSQVRSVPVLGHHGFFSWDSHAAETVVERGWDRYARGSWHQARNQLVEAVALVTGQPKECFTPVQTILYSGLVVIADRLASQPQAAREVGLSLRDPAGWVRSRQEFFDRLLEETLGVYQHFTDPEVEILGQHLPNELQKLVQDHRSGLLVVKTPTGGGKTEAALLRHSREAGTLTFLLPTQSTTDTMMARLDRAFEQTPNVGVLAHGEAWLADVDEGASLTSTDFVSNRADRLLAPVTVGTVDQALMAALPLKWIHLRLTALANSHVVIDEAHTMDSYQVGLAEILLWWLGQVGATTTLLSATLPTENNSRLISAYSGDKPEGPALFSSVTAGGQDYLLPAPTFEIDLLLEQAENTSGSHIAWVKEIAAQNPQARVGVIVNTVGSAQKIGLALADCGLPVLVLHSRMTAAHKSEVAEEVIRQLGPGGDGKGLVVVGTQTLEASLDFDVDFLSTDLAPATSLIQRAGRLWRRPDSQRSVRAPHLKQRLLRVVQGTSPVGHYPYAKASLSRAWKFLSARQFLVSPTDIQAFVETASVGFGDSEDEWAEAAEESLKRQASHAGRVDLAKILRPQTYVEDLEQLTTWAPSGADLDGGVPKTRYVRGLTQRVVFAQRPTGKVDREELRKLLAAAIPTNGKIAAELTDLLEPLGYSGVLVGPMPSTYSYDPLVGLLRTQG